MDNSGQSDVTQNKIELLIERDVQYSTATVGSKNMCSI